MAATARSDRRVITDLEWGVARGIAGFRWLALSWAAVVLFLTRADVDGPVLGAALLLLGLFVSLFARGDGSTFSLIMLGLLYGAAFGIVFGLISYAFTGGKRDFLSRSQITAERYDLHCDAGVLGQARSILGISAFDTPQPPETPEAH